MSEFLGLDIGYFERANNKQDFSDLVTIDCTKWEGHTLIFAGSGSGKSFLLGRLLEELMLKTKANCAVIDPNADFRNFHIPDWKPKADDYGVTESTEEEFTSLWSPVATSFSKVDERNPGFSITHVNPAVLVKAWNANIDFDLQGCARFLHACADLRTISTSASELEETIRRFRSYFHLAKEFRREEFEATILSNFNLSKDTILQAQHPLIKEPPIFLTDKMIDSARSVDHAAARLFFNAIEDLGSSKLFAPCKLGNIFSNDVRLLHVDLQLININHRRAVIDAIMNRVWEEALANSVANNLSATFVVIDEAHNVLPAPMGREDPALEIFRRFAAEGRKFGIRLILVTQRPDKLDPAVVSECENRIVMRLNTEKDFAPGLLPDLAEGTLKGLKKGNAIMYGSWASGMTQPRAGTTGEFRSLARRTAQGGANLKPEQWLRKTSSPA